MDWLLILTLQSYENGSALTTAQFHSEKTCKAAANTWKRQSSGQKHYYISALCVKVR